MELHGVKVPDKEFKPALLQFILHCINHSDLDAWYQDRGCAGAGGWESAELTRQLLYELVGALDKQSTDKVFKALQVLYKDGCKK